MNSLTQAGENKVCLWSDQFILNGRESEILLFKIMIRESHLNTNATMNSIRTQLSNLDECITTIGCDITKFNKHVKRLLEQLNAPGGEDHDLLTNLFKAYVSVKDAHFVNYVNEKLSQYEEGEPMESDQLMTLMANKHKKMMIQNQWEAPYPHDATIQAHQSKVVKLQWELKQALNIRTRKRRRRDTVRNHNAPNGWPTMRNHKLDNFPASGCGTETNGIGAPEKQEVNVRDAGSVTLPYFAKGRHLKVSI